MAKAKPRTSTSDPTASGEGGWRALLWRPRLFALAATFLICAGAGGAWGSWQNLCAGDACPSIAQIKTWEPEQTSKLLSHDGQLITEIGFERRTPVSIQALPFYEHGGFDPRGIARAVFGVLTGRNLGGGSTITQQLARNMFEGQIGFERRVLRKLKELQVALDLERSYTKDQILEAYLNEIYMGRGYGYQNAARNYLGKNASEEAYQVTKEAMIITKAGRRSCSA